MKGFFEKKAMEIFGEEYVLDTMERMLGGAQKYTYLAKCTNGFAFVIYQWGEDTTYFEDNGDSAMFCSSSAELFQKNNDLMRTHGVLTPKLFYMDRSRSTCDYDYAFVEYIDGHDMDYIMENEPDRLQKVIESLNKNIDKLHSIKNEVAGQIGRMQTSDFDILSYELEGMRANSSYLQENDKDYAKMYLQVVEKAAACVEKLEKRKEYTFTHGELGPNHVIVDKDDNAYLIDIEGAKYYDVEQELSFLDMRFDKKIRTVDNEDNETRMLFYLIGHCLSNMRGAIELKQKGYYDMDDVNGMIDFFHDQVEALHSL